MIDTLHRFRDAALRAPPPAGRPRRYGVVTLHRPSNVDRKEALAGILEALGGIAKELPLIWPIHPRTRQRIAESGLAQRAAASGGLELVAPLGYVDFLAAMARAALVLTDSGGVQEEALVLKVPAVTLRENTERPVTLECGGNLLVGSDPTRIRDGARAMLAKDPDSFTTPELWDGQAAPRIADRIDRFFAEGGGL
jgi:UDP-N-acetylglucosamine 2-epimerase (non-hydrolysing)